MEADRGCAKETAPLARATGAGVGAGRGRRVDSIAYATGRGRGRERLLPLVGTPPEYGEPGDEGGAPLP